MSTTKQAKGDSGKEPKLQKLNNLGRNQAQSGGLFFRPDKTSLALFNSRLQHRSDCAEDLSQSTSPVRNSRVRSRECNPLNPFQRAQSPNTLQRVQSTILVHNPQICSRERNPLVRYKERNPRIRSRESNPRIYSRERIPRFWYTIPKSVPESAIP